VRGPELCLGSVNEPSCIIPQPEAPLTCWRESENQDDVSRGLPRARIEDSVTPHGYLASDGKIRRGGHHRFTACLAVKDSGGRPNQKDDTAPGVINRSDVNGRRPTDRDADITRDDGASNCGWSTRL
jgi:hypothetical protein